MKNIKFYTLASLMFLSICALGMNTSKGSNENLLEDIKTSAQAFEKSITSRNFKDAKEHLLVLYPLMKKEFKEAKKQIHAMEKEGDQTNAEKLQSALDRKIEIHDRLHGLAEASSASLRVQSDDAKALVKEYVDLLKEKQQLLSSLN